jgi:hypothetical protein
MIPHRAPAGDVISARDYDIGEAIVVKVAHGELSGLSRFSRTLVEDRDFIELGMRADGKQRQQNGGSRIQSHTHDRSP